MTTQVYFSDELVDMFVAGVHRVNKSNLSSCNLVSKQWHRITIPHLFSRVYVPYRPPRKTFDQLAKYLMKRSDIAAHIESLVLSGSPAERRGDVGILDISTFAALLSILPHLRKLLLSSLVVRSNGEYEQYEPKYSLASMTWYYVDVMRPGPRKYEVEFPEVFGLFSQIQHFNPCGRDISSDRMYTDVTAVSSPRIEDVEVVGDFPSHRYLKLLQNVDAIRNLTSITVDIEEEADLIAFGELLEEVGHGLKAVKIDAVSMMLHYTEAEEVDPDREAVCDALRSGLAACRTLHYFEIVGELSFASETEDEDEDKNEEAWLVLTDIVSLLDSASIQHLTIRLYVRDSNSPFPWTRKSINWATLRATCRRFEELMSIVLACQYCNSEDPWEDGGADHVIPEMQEFHEGGKLFLEHKTPDPVCAQPGCCWYKEDISVTR